MMLLYKVPNNNMLTYINIQISGLCIHKPCEHVRGIAKCPFYYIRGGGQKYPKTVHMVYEWSFLGINYSKIYLL